MSECICPCGCRRELVRRDVQQNLWRCASCRERRTTRCKRPQILPARQHHVESEAHVEALFAKVKREQGPRFQA